nr:hypothetical protein [Tanacetum cinerariifolium]
METEEANDRYIMTCFVGGLHAYDGEINLENEKNKILNEFAVKLLLDYEEKNGEKIMKKELLVALKGEMLTKGIVDFRNGVTTIYHDLDHFGDDYDNSNNLGDDWEAILEGVDFGDITQLDGIDVPPLFSIWGRLTQEEMTRKALEKDMYERILILQEPRPIIETLKFKEATEEVIRSYKTIREKNDLGIFVLPIRIKAKVDSFALADTGSNINVIPYRIYAKLGREEVKPLNKKTTMLDHSKAEPMGIMKDVLCQVGVTIILAKFLILEIPMDKDVPIVVGKSFLHTCEEIINTIKGRNDFEAGLSSLPKRTRQHETVEEAMLPTFIMNFCIGGTSNRAAIEDMLEIKVYKMGEDEEIFTSEAWRHAFNIREHVYAELCHDFYATFDFDETITDEDLMSKKVIKFRLGGCVYTMTILEFAYRLGLNSSDEIQYEGFETYFHGGLRNDDHFNVNQYWSEISSENELIMSRSSARTIRKPRPQCVTKDDYDMCQRTTGYDKGDHVAGLICFDLSSLRLRLVVDVVEVVDCKKLVVREFLVVE